MRNVHKVMPLAVALAFTGAPAMADPHKDESGHYRHGADYVIVHEHGRDRRYGKRYREIARERAKRRAELRRERAKRYREARRHWRKHGHRHEVRRPRAYVYSYAYPLVHLDIQL